MDVGSVKVIKIGRVRQLRHLLGCKNWIHGESSLCVKPGDTRRIGKPQLRRVESVQENLKNMDLRNWSRVTGPRTVEDSFFF
jgi:hypothetical protein